MGYDFFKFKCDKLSGDYCTVTGEEVSRDQKNEICTSSSYLDNCAIYQKCYVVTAVCETLKEPKYIRISKGFKKKLIESGKYQEQLAIYNAIGPVIANRIQGNERICRILFERTIKPVCKLIEEGKDDEALGRFVDMVTQFIEPECRTNQENCRPNGVFIELMQYAPTTIRECEEAATTTLCIHNMRKILKPNNSKIA